VTPKQTGMLRQMFPHGFLIVVACGDGKQIEMESYEPVNPFTKLRIRNENTQFIEIMTKELLSVGDWSDVPGAKRADVAKLARDSEDGPNYQSDDFSGSTESVEPAQGPS